MKRIVIFIIVATLVTIAFFQFKQYRRFHPPADYEYATNSKEIDAHYHNPALIDEYYEKAYEVGSFARQAWFNHQIDVRFPDEADTHSLQANAHYKQLLARLKSIETKLKRSKELKEKGFDNKAIALMEKEGISEKQYNYMQVFGDTTLKVGDKNALVWQYQKLLSEKGFKIKTDGVFDEETEKATRTFQEKNDLYPSGIANKRTIQKLFL